MRQALGQLLKDKKGSNLIFVIVYMLLFLIIVIGLSTVSIFGANSSKIQRNYTQAYYAAKTINMSICDAITSEEGLPLINAWESDFSDIIEYYTTPEGIIEIPDGELSYRKEAKKEYNIPNTDIQVTNEISIVFVAEVNEDENSVTIGGTVNVETTSVHQNQSYTMKAELINVPSTGGGSGGGQGSKGKYVIGTTGSSNMNQVTYIGGILSDEDININKVTVSGGVYSPKNINISNDSNISGGVMSNKTVTFGNITESGDVIAENIVFNESASTVTGDIIAGKDIQVRSGSHIDGNIIALNRVTVTGSDMSVTKNILSFKDVDIQGSSAKIDGSVVTSGFVRMNGGRVGGNLLANGNITLSGVTVEGDIKSNGSINITNSKIEGEIYSKEAITLTGTEVAGDITAGKFIKANGGNGITGNVYSNENIELKDTGMVTGNIYSVSGITMTGVDGVTGDIYTNGSIELTNTGNINGNIYSLSDMRLTNIQVIGNAYSDGNVTMPNNGGVENIYANGWVEITGAAVAGNIESVGYVKMTRGSVNNIFTNGELDITGAAVSENIKANGSITAGWGVSVNGTAYSNSTIDSKTDFAKEPNVPVPFPSLHVEINLDDYFHDVSSIDSLINSTMASIMNSNILSKIDSIGTVQNTPNIEWHFIDEPALGSESQLEQCLGSGVFDARNGDLYFETDDNLIIGDISIIGEHRVFIRMTGSNKSLAFISKNSDLDLAEQLYFISDYPNFIEMKKYIGNNWYYGETINAQIYMPKADFDPGWGIVRVNGILTIKGALNNNQWYSNLTLNLVQGNYENTNIKDILGADIIEPVEVNGDWSVKRYYQ